MKKLLERVNANTLAKLAPMGIITALSVSNVFCTDIFVASKSVLNKVSTGLISIISVVAFIMIIWNIIMLFVHSSDEKKLAVNKEAIKKIFIYYIIAIVASFLLSTVAGTISNVIGGENVIDTGTINSSGELK